MTITLLIALSAISADDGRDFFEARVRPVLVRRCEKCHGPTKTQGGLRLDSRAGWVKGGDSGAVIVPGDPAASPLVRAIAHAPDDDRKMPPTGKIPQAEIEALTEWVRRGAIDPRDTAAASPKSSAMTLDEAKSWWAFRPVARPEAPDRKLGEDPIDAFLRVKLDEARVTPAPRADKRTLIRRATYDLTGLPPSPDDVGAFLADDSAGAFAKVVDRLLASSRYGERWGRHWLDLARYADTAGENSDHPVPHAWRYRNWVFESFNRDRPYDEFVRLQIAGDLLAKDAPPAEAAEGIIATGFLAVARRFGNDIDKDMHLTREDVIDTTGKALLGLTLGCARCHDHKYDPISADDYYALSGIFASTRFPFPGCEPKPQPRDLVKLPDRPGSKEPAWAYAVAEGKVANARVDLGGDPEKPGLEAPRHWLKALGGQAVPAGEGSGRKALGEWIASRDNPLTPRVMVNRVWQGHFGRGIVATPNDFGSRGIKPTHPELLDLLAAEFVESGWRIKPLHRRIMLTEAYQRSSMSAASPSDSENQWLGRFSRRRLTAEEVRDSLLAAGGSLDLSPGGPHPFPPEATWTFTQHVPFTADYATNRRTAYVMITRNRRDPFLSLFDGADPNSTTPDRPVTTVPTQGLFFLNAAIVHEQSARLAGRAFAEDTDADRLDRLYAITLQRRPTNPERERAASFLKTYDDADPRARWSALARVLLSSNEFLYMD